MPIEVMDMIKMACAGKRKVIFNTKKFHAWVHVYANPGDKDDMHCHNADQTFYVIDGECTLHFPDGGKAVMKPGMVATITGGSFYQLENTGTGPMVLMGNRSGLRKRFSTSIMSYEKTSRHFHGRRWRRFVTAAMCGFPVSHRLRSIGVSWRKMRRRPRPSLYPRAWPAFTLRLSNCHK